MTEMNESNYMDQVVEACMKSESKDPFAILDELMALPFCRAIGPEHHVIVGCALLTAYKNAGGDIDLEKALMESYERGSQVPVAVCGKWGACGAAVATGQFVSIVTNATPLTEETWSFANRMTSLSLNAMAEVGGPRCCKRNGKLALLEAVRFARENLGVEMESNHDLTCTYVDQIKECIGERCPFFPQN